jgi:hypothetical protein
MKPELKMYTSGNVRVIVFGGVLSGMLAAYEHTPAWANAFALAKKLRVKITPAYGYAGPVSQ